jgi:glycogen synthase
MRVLHLTTEFPPVIFGGLGTAVGGLARASAQAGADVGVLLVGSGVSGYGDSITAAPVPASAPAPGVAVEPAITVYPTSWGDALESALALCRWWRPDVVHLHVFWLWDIARELCQRAGLPMAYTVHSLDVAEYQLGGGPSECLDQWQVQRAVLEHADVIHAPSLSEAELVVHYCPASAPRVAVAGHGIDDLHGHSRRRRYVDDADTTVLFVGRFVDRKGIRELLAAIPSVLERAPGTRFVLSGGHRNVTGAEMERHWLPAELTPFSDRILFTGWLSPEETSAWYARADVLVVPSWYEPFGMVVLEGMLEEMAIAASAVGGPGEILEHGRTGLLFPPRDVDALAGAVIRLATDHGLRDRLGTAAGEEVRRNWLWPSAIVPVHDMYSRAMRTPSRLKAQAA